jgi:hypothetical protein
MNPIRKIKTFMVNFIFILKKNGQRETTMVIKVLLILYKKKINTVNREVMYLVENLTVFIRTLFTLYFISNLCPNQPNLIIGGNPSVMGRPTVTVTCNSALQGCRRPMRASGPEG